VTEGVFFCIQVELSWFCQLLSWLLKCEASRDGSLERKLWKVWWQDLERGGQLKQMYSSRVVTVDDLWTTRNIIFFVPEQFERAGFLDLTVKLSCLINHVIPLFCGSFEIIVG